ncbi:Anaphase-promoting complex subunit 4 [Haplosporangium sp. Z 767]|nr:Anaphase-promoting complex subunit 4 [Haplosporangium sp. Z 767]
MVQFMDAIWILFYSPSVDRVWHCVRGGLTSTSTTGFIPTFDIYSEKQFPTGYKLEAWCPTADLLALVNHQNELDLYRLSWKRHWSVPVKVQAAPAGGATINSTLGQHGLKLHGFGVEGGASMLQHHHHAGVPVGAATTAVSAVSLVWRPDGKMIAVGLSNGYVNVYDYKDGSLSYSIAPSDIKRPIPRNISTKGCMRCLRWADISLGRHFQPAFLSAHQTSKSILDALLLLSPIPPSTQQQMMLARSIFNKNNQGAVGAGKSGLNQKASTELPDEESSYIMNVLFAGDDQGYFLLRLFGSVETERISLSQLVEASGDRRYKSLSILKADIQLDLSEMTVIALASKLKENESAEDPTSERRLVQITLSSELLHRHAREIRSLGLTKKPIDSLLGYMAEALQVINTDFKKVSQMTEDCLESVQQILTDNGEVATAPFEFVQMFMTGRPSASLDQYLQNELSHHGLKRWEKSTKAAYANIRRVAFECLLPACERLMIHLSDILGCSRWTEEYSPLRLEETLVFICIKIVGDFVGSIERLFQVLKTELKHFSEFNNWLQQETLQPTIRDPDDPDEDSKIFAPVDIQSVSEYLTTGLTNKALGGFFLEPDQISTPNSDQGDLNSSDMKTLHPSEPTKQDQVAAAYYDATPSYPIVYTFSEELQSIPSESHSAKVRTPEKAPLEPEKKKSSNPFAGSAFRAAMSSRGFGPLTSKKHASPTLSSKNGAGASETASIVTQHTPSPSKPSLSSLTLERHLALMADRCKSIFETPAAVVARSVKVIHIIDLMDLHQSKAPQGDHDDDGGKGQDDAENEDEIIESLKIATRYCYHATRGSRASTLPRSNVQLNESVATATWAADLNQFRKRKASSELRESTKSGAKSSLPHSDDSTALGSLPSVSNHPTITESAGDIAPCDLEEQDVEVVMLSLQDHGSTLEGLASSHQNLATTQHDPTRPCFGIRDLSFLDDDTLGVLLNSSMATSTTATSAAFATTIREEQFLVSVPLQSLGRPYHPIPVSGSMLTLAEPLPQSCILNKLIQLLGSGGGASHGEDAADANPPLVPFPLVRYSLPVSRSKCVTQFSDPAYMESPPSCSSTPKDTAIAAEVSNKDKGSSARYRGLIGPCRISSNEREKSRVISLHGPPHEGASILEGAGKITVFDL